MNSLFLGFIIAVIGALCARVIGETIFSGIGETPLMISGAFLSVALFVPLELKRRTERRKLIREYRRLGLTTLEEGE